MHKTAGLLFRKRAADVKIVNGPAVRNCLDVRFTGGGNHEAYPKLVPPGQIWVEDTGNLQDMAATAHHEEVESERMRKLHESYKQAHRHANRAEAVARGAPKPPAID